MKNRFIEETKERKNHDKSVKKWKKRGVEMESRKGWEKMESSRGSANKY